MMIRGVTIIIRLEVSAADAGVAEEAADVGDLVEDRDTGHVPLFADLLHTTEENRSAVRHARPLYRP